MQDNNEGVIEFKKPEIDKVTELIGELRSHIDLYMDNKLHKDYLCAMLETARYALLEQE